MNSKSLKDEIRTKVWRALMEKNAALPPFPIFGRIPNFRGAGEAAERLKSLTNYRSAEAILCNPDSPQRPVREMILRDGKILIVATPRMSKGFMAIERSDDPFYDSTIRGLMERGRPVNPGDYKIDLFIAGSVAVSREGYRLGKGTAYSDTEYNLWKRAGSIDEKTISITTVHDLQVLDYVPRDEWDVPVDLIITPTRTMWTVLGSKRLNLF
ncbi:MAG: 5-formyltetrahydrofolate cyclo-ligase [Candidatus Methanomethylicaceae archaeon]|nr:5-formyltetrahydrofolate cyclo-ligase [Candidatus Verstraetearchaeota archaeon]